MSFAVQGVLKLDYSDVTKATQAINQMLGGLTNAGGRGAVYGGARGFGLTGLPSIIATMGPAGIAFAGASAAAQKLTSSLTDLVNTDIELIEQCTMLAARVETLGVALNKVGANAGYSSEEMAAFEEGVTQMNITTQSARQSMLYMAEAQIDFNYASKLARVAQDAAVIGNINSSEAFQRLVWAVERGEPRMLRYIGINVSFERAYARQASAIGRTVKELTEREKAEIRVNEVLRVGARLSGTYEAAMDTAGKRLLSLQRVQEQIQLKLGNVFLKAFSEGIFGMYDAMTSLEKYLDKNKDHIDGISKSLGELAKKAIDAAREIGKTVVGAAGTETIPEKVDVGLRQYMAAVALRQQTRVSPIAITGGNINQTLGTGTSALSKLLSGSAETGKYARGQIKSLTDLLGITQYVTEAQDKLGISQSNVNNSVDAGTTAWEKLAESIRDTFTPYQELQKVMEMTELQQRALIEGTTVQALVMEENKKAVLSFVQEAKGLWTQIETAQEEAENELVIRQMKYDDDMEQANKKLTESLIDIDIKSSEKRQDIWTDYYQSMQDIAVKNSRAVSDATTDFERDRAEKIRKYYDDEQQATIDYGRKRADIERDYQQEVRDIKTDYSFNAEELIRKQDAIGLLRLRRETKQRIKEAKVNHQDETEDAVVEYNRRREDLSRSLQIEQRELNISHQQKLADLNKALERERADENTNRNRRLADAQRDWARERNETGRKYARDKADLDKALRDQNEVERVRLEQRVRVWQDKLNSLIAANASAVNAIRTMWSNLISSISGGGATGINPFNYGMPSGIQDWYTGNYGQGGQVSWALANSRYSPPATPTYTGGRMGGGNRKMDINIRLDGNGILDDAGRSQVIGIVKEVVTNALAG